MGQVNKQISGIYFKRNYQSITSGQQGVGPVSKYADIVRIPDICSNNPEVSLF